MLFSRARTQLVTPERALRGRDHYRFTVPDTHEVNGRPIQAPFPPGHEQIVFGLGCFWGAEEIFWAQPGVWTTAVGYAGGSTAHPTYQEVCSGRTGHTEAVLVDYDPEQTDVEALIATFFEIHDPTQGMRQGNDVGTQYRSAVYCTTDRQREVADRASALYARTLADRRYGRLTTEIAMLGRFYYAEPEHQQYLAKHPAGYRCHSTTGVAFPASELRTNGTHPAP